VKVAQFVFQQAHTMTQHRDRLRHVVALGSQGGVDSHFVTQARR
jgi:bisphosphoglycerate-independent phosphoglycerate mutase (AlkP superfamily)